jgi:hypothetical protein
MRDSRSEVIKDALKNAPGFKYDKQSTTHLREIPPRSKRRQLGTDQASSGRWMSLKLLPALVVFALDVSDVSIT